MGSTVYKRQIMTEDNNGTFAGDDSNFDDRRGEFWYSPEAEIAKWAIVGGITFIFMVWLIGGYLHAKRRVRKGLKPLRYHRFLLPRDQRGHSGPQNNFSFYRQDSQGYGMDSYGPPPPVYNPDHPMPPGYVPPEGSSKANPSQEWITPPPGAPPSVTPSSGAPADPEAGIQPDPKTSRFTKFKPLIPKPGMPSISSKLNPFSK